MVIVMFGDFGVQHFPMRGECGSRGSRGAVKVVGGTRFKRRWRARLESGVVFGGEYLYHFDHFEILCTIVESIMLTTEIHCHFEDLRLVPFVRDRMLKRRTEKLSPSLLWWRWKFFIDSGTSILALDAVYGGGVQKVVIHAHSFDEFEDILGNVLDI